MKLFYVFFFSWITMCYGLEIENLPRVAATQNSLAVRSTQMKAFARRELIDDLKDLVSGLFENISGALDQATSAIENFTSSLECQLGDFVSGIESNVENLGESIEGFVSDLNSTIQDITDGVQSCIDNSTEDASSLLNETLASITSCGTNRVESISVMINSLIVLVENSSTVVEEVLSEVDLCYNTTGNEPMSLAMCLAGVVIDAEWKATGFLTQTGYQIFQINLSLASLPAALEVCAGTGLVNAAMDVGNILGDIASCLAASAYDYLTCNSTMYHKEINKKLVQLLTQ